MASFCVTCRTLAGSSHVIEVNPDTPIEELRARCTSALGAMPEVRLMLGSTELRGGTCAEAGVASCAEVTLVICEAWAIEAVRACSENRCWERAGSKEKDRALAALVLIGGLRDIDERHSQVFLDIISRDSKWNGTPVVIRLAQVFALSCKADVFAKEIVQRLLSHTAPSYLSEAALAIALAEIVRRDRRVLSTEEVQEVLQFRLERFKTWVQLLGTFSNPVIVDAVLAVCRLAREVGNPEILEALRVRLGVGHAAEPWHEDALKLLTRHRQDEASGSDSPPMEGPGDTWRHILRHGADPSASPSPSPHAESAQIPVPSACSDLMAALLKALAAQELFTRGQPLLLEARLPKELAESAGRLAEPTC